MTNTIKGAKAGVQQPRQPVIDLDSAQSKTFIKILYGLSEGTIKGLSKGYQSIFLDDTPLQDANGNWNFENVSVDFREGTNDQTYIEGFPDISSETAIGVELKSETPWVKAFNNTELDAVRLRLRWGPLRQQNESNGDVNGYTIRYAVDVQTDGGTWTEVLNTQISDKTSANYERSHRIELPKADSGWQVRIRRLTPNTNSEFISDKMYVQAVTEVIDAKIRYPNTALLGLRYDAQTFSNVAKMAVECEGVEILVPSNYNPETRIYTGLWDGTFKRAYSNNPAWHFYDACTAKRYALGNRINSSMIDKWSIYRLGQYCDQLVPDGKGGQEPRFTLNVYEQSQDDAWSVLSKMAGAFRAYVYWDGQSIVCDADIPQDTVYTFTSANVIDGRFEYSGTRARDRHTIAKVAYDNPENRYKTEYEIVRDEAAIAKYGIRILDISAYGCTSVGQAQRAGNWALKTEQFETRTVTFKVGLDGFIPRPGKVIEIADPIFAGRANGGRISSVSSDLKSITVDRDEVVCRAGDRLVVNGEDGKAQARIVQSKNGRVITVVSAFDSVAAQNVWVVDAQDLATMKFRVVSITRDDTHQFTITGLQYNPAKFDAIDQGTFIDDRPITIINPNIQSPVESVSVSSDNMVQQGLTVATMLISWPQATSAVKYLVEWRKDDGSWIKMPITGNNSVEVQGIYSGNYQAKVTAINAFEVASLPTFSIITELKGKQGTPPALAFINATGILFGIKLDWGFPAVGALDTAYTEIQVSPDGVSNIAQLGLFAYPTTTHTLQGLQPNLKQYYRARLIDRIGNIGPWSDWVNATTSADASAVLEVLSGKITESQLHQDLQEKIDKIDEMGGDIGDLVQAIQNAENGITQERNERIAGDNQVLNELTIYKLSNDQKVAAVIEEVDVLIDDQQTLATKIDGVYAKTTPLTADQTDWTADSSSNQASSWSIQSAQIDGDNAIAKRVDLVQTTVGENTASIEEVTQSVDGLYGQKFTKIDVNGKVIGWGGANDGVEGIFVFNVDSLAIGSGNSMGYYPFIFRNTPFTDPVTGTVFPVSAYFKAAMFDYQSVNTSHIKDLAVQRGKIAQLAVGSGQIDDLAVTRGKIADLAVDTLKIADNAVTVPVSAFAEISVGVDTEYVTIQTLNVPSDMGHTVLTFGAVFSFAGYDSKQQVYCRVLKNDQVVFEDLEVHFIEHNSVALITDANGSHNHNGSTVNVSGTTGQDGSHSHSYNVNGTTGSTNAGGTYHNHSFSASGSTGNVGGHSHSFSASGNITMSEGGAHTHKITVQGTSRSAGTINISRHDSTGIYGTYKLQLRVVAGSSMNVSQRYIHAMTMRK